MLGTAARTASRLGCVALVAAGLGCGESESPDGAQQRLKVGDPGPVHVHGLGINPSDGALFIATHTGLFRAEEGQRKAKRVAGRYQDTMGFTVIGSDRFLGSGHPDLREKLPPFLGLIESRDAGQNWKPISLMGKRDFHVLEARGRRVYGFGSDFETREAALLVSDDGGRSWQRRDTPEGLISLAINPRDLDHIVASGEKGLYESRDAARGWRPLDGEPGLVAWPAADRLVAVAIDGVVTRSDDTGRTWRELGSVGGPPAAFESQGATELYVALHDGIVKRSTDGGASWSVRSSP
jgi:photosystem II stability/assembly factor-like uncharacterized protein